ncbi:MAG: TRAP transporter small permease subunit [Burkholderiales bacterium]
MVEAIDGLNELIGRVCAWLLLPMVALAFCVVGLRYVANVGYPWLSEAFVWLNGAIVLLASADVLRTDQHVRVDLFFKRFSARGRAAVDFFGVWLLLMPMVVVTGYFAWPIARFSAGILESSPTPDGLPLLWVLKLLIPAFCVLIGLQGLALSIRAWRTLRDDRAAV